ncbi:hypothetical protein L596_008359 [Steinernema carpocapsae]|uniref:Aminopeptidase P N-terminal domain-containing protein n=1 Tax=Steinernema carpocapsae TaxID=34508 RepID=A0A4U5PCD4_STECR|nr:hypothetical protein L596_008359 [Steinernema carpocapsae]
MTVLTRCRRFVISDSLNSAASALLSLKRSPAPLNSKFCLPIFALQRRGIETSMPSMGVTTNKLERFRALFADKSIVKCDGIEAYILPSTDAHQSEYISDHDFRVKFLSGFAGSNAFTIITKNEALLWTDGRYFIQANEQMEDGWTLMKQGLPESVDPVDWMVENLSSSVNVGFDPQLFGYAKGEALVKKLKKVQINAVPSEVNLVDKIWEDRPAASDAPIMTLSAEECGELSSSKIQRVRETLKKKKCDSVVFTALDDIAWLLNIRGSDICYNPVVFSVAVVSLDDVALFIDQKKVAGEAAQKHLAHVKIFDYAEAPKYIGTYHKTSLEKSGASHKMWIPDVTNFFLASLVNSKNIYVALSPVQTMKAVKNEVELQGMRDCHIRDAASHVQFLIWLQKQIAAGVAVTELEAADHFEKLRSQREKYVSLSFDTISAVGDHSALPHYKAGPESGKRIIAKDSVYLVDSGGQYRDGTTDVTRTVCAKENPDADFKKMFTLVLKGHIDTALLKFPSGINGMRIDMVARKPLWDDGYDFGHGVGHGVGHFLNVHEGPAGIAYRMYREEGKVVKGYILTIEPGFYDASRWGIRIENCYEVMEAKGLESGATNYLTFASLTFVPIQKNLIERSLLSSEEIDWLDAYHAECLAKVGPYLQEHNMKEEYEWLQEACKPL